MAGCESVRPGCFGSARAAKLGGMNTPVPPQDFERALDELETLVTRLEAGDMTLEESLGAYERGVALYRQCQGALEQAELRIKLLGDPADPESAREFKPDAE